jgi:hypothetical protein
MIERKNEKGSRKSTLKRERKQEGEKKEKRGRGNMIGKA